MIILIEGIDGSGKTTLAKQLAAYFKLEYYHEGVPPPSVSMLDHYGQLLQAARGRGVVFDRLGLGERVYGPIIRNDDRLGDDGWRVFHRLITASGAYQVLCTPSYETCLKNWSSGRPEYVSRVTQFKSVYDRYQNLQEPDMIVFDYEHDSLGALINKLGVQRKVLPTNMVGDPGGSYLFVGERGSNATTNLDLPFFGTTHSSGYLNRALELACYEERELAFMNAFSLKGYAANMIPIFPRVIALGREAHIVCDSQGVDHHQVPHPQFWSRFHHDNIIGYASLLKNCQL
jgi:hypothetical protein